MIFRFHGRIHTASGRQFESSIESASSRTEGTEPAQSAPTIFLRPKTYAVDANGMCELNIQRTVEGDSFYHCLLDTGSEASYSSNVHLAGQSLGNIGDKIVVLYEGEAGKQDYIHDGRAVVAFVDGHTKMVTEDDAKQLRWMP